ncbi:unnamed protein product [Pleuronectes platessa]|uniref:Dystroglycan C-terminal domain-containing protein n=1 Tax=Pleuronectes platessa TaxID=8262 RepID=A0A9N7UJB2_PLEPL|nr:unnamed protein product [Pleuronectes platessa]
MICYRKKRKGKRPSRTRPPSSRKACPLSLRTNSTTLAASLFQYAPDPAGGEAPTPPEYPNMATPETTPLNQELLGEYTALQDDDPNAPPYQPHLPSPLPWRARAPGPRT